MIETNVSRFRIQKHEVGCWMLIQLEKYDILKKKMINESIYVIQFFVSIKHGWSDMVGTVGLYYELFI